MAHRLVLLTVPLVALALLAAAPADASRRQRSLIQDDHLLLQSGPDAQARALDDVVVLGAEGVRAVLLWRDLAPRDMRSSAEFASLLESASDLGIAHDAAVRYVSRQTVVRGMRFHFTEWGDPG